MRAQASEKHQTPAFAILVDYITISKITHNYAYMCDYFRYQIRTSAYSAEETCEFKCILGLLINGSW